jgi:hypothetical protein
MNTTPTCYWTTVITEALKYGDYKTAAWAETNRDYYNTLTKIYE